ncbi:LacI family DNA-binding transcriptional regulator [Fundicoccus sp. Sow4_D5]|uniref:LacI family DNA-binding transcriptional regulator n=1 Tax=Fundicoccus sp. Sow4_D5 TaxID=3438782 RepID=UPI003F8FD293
MRITMKHIAQEAGVSVMTVSNVINGKGGKVSIDKRIEIEKIIKKYNYSPNMNAKALVNASSRLIGLLYYSDGPGYDFSDPFATEVLSGIESIAKKENYFILIHNVNSLEDIQEIQSNWAFSGFIAVGFYQEIYLKMVEAVSVPIVFVDTHLDNEGEALNNSNVYFVKSDDYLQAKKAVDFLYSQGHEKIGFLSYNFDLEIVGVIEQRFNGYKDSLLEKGLSFDKDLIFNDSDFDKLIENLKQFTALFVTADFLAMNFIKYLRNKGLYDVNRLSIISVDDIRYAELNNPPLTTIRLNQVYKGSVAIERIIQIVEKQSDIPKVTIIEGELIERDSVSWHAKKVDYDQ